MKWRNIHIQPSSASNNNQGIFHARPPSLKYNPRRSEQNLSRLIDTSYENTPSHSSQEKKPHSQTRKNKNISSAILTKKFVVTEDWIIRLKIELNKIIRISQSLCGYIKNYVYEIKNSLKASTQKFKDEIIKKMAAITYELALINIPNLSECQKCSPQSQSSLKFPTQNSLNELIKPFALTQSNFAEFQDENSPTKIENRKSLLHGLTFANQKAEHHIGTNQKIDGANQTIKKKSGHEKAQDKKTIDSIINNENAKQQKFPDLQIEGLSPILNNKQLKMNPIADRTIKKQQKLGKQPKESSRKQKQRQSIQRDEKIKQIQEQIAAQKRQMRNIRLIQQKNDSSHSSITSKQKNRDKPSSVDKTAVKKTMKSLKDCISNLKIILDSPN